MKNLKCFFFFFMIEKLETIARQAGDIILKYYNPIGLNINVKSDGFPFTNADISFGQLIVSKLKNIF